MEFIFILGQYPHHRLFAQKTAYVEIIQKYRNDKSSSDAWLFSFLKSPNMLS